MKNIFKEKAKTKYGSFLKLRYDYKRGQFEVEDFGGSTFTFEPSEISMVMEMAVKISDEVCKIYKNNKPKVK